MWMRHTEYSRTFRAIGKVPAKAVAVVLGAKVYPSGALSSVLQGRVDSAIELYKAGKVKKLLMTGDNGTRRYDEVTAMKRYAMEHGVPDTDIVRDYAGFRTFDSCYRARHIFGVKNAVIVTQDFHMPRSLYLARSCGIDAVGYVAPDNMSSRALRSLKLREYAATLTAVADAVSPWKRPRLGGPVEPIDKVAMGR
jgi:SanA protein